MATQSGTLKAGYQLYIDIANGDSSTVFDYTVTGASVRDNGKAWKSDRVIGPFVEDVSYTVTYTGSPSIYKVQPNGQREYTDGELPDPAALGAGDTVVVDGKPMVRIGNRWSRQDLAGKPAICTSRNVHMDLFSTMSSNVTRGYELWVDFLSSVDVDGIDLTFTNLIVATNGVETDNTSTPTIRVGVRKQSEQYVTPVFFGGNRNRQMAAGEIVTSDKTPLSLKAGVDEGFFIRVHFTVATTSDKIVASLLQNTNSTRTNTDIFLGHRIDGAPEAFVDTWNYNVGSKLLGQATAGPSLVRGWASDGGSIPSVIVFGSSGAQGSGDTQEAPYYVAGYSQRAAMRDRIPYLVVAQAGEQGTDFVNGSGAKRRRLVELANATHGVCYYGSNDIQNGKTLAQMQTMASRMKLLMEGYGLVPLFAGMTPVTTSTDSWVTVENQTVSAYQSVREAYDAWLKTSSGYKVLDLLSKCDSGIAAGGSASWKWRVDLGDPSDDGLHAKKNLQVVIAEAIDYSGIFF